MDHTVFEHLLILKPAGVKHGITSRRKDREGLRYRQWRTVAINPRQQKLMRHASIDMITKYERNSMLNVTRPG